MTARNYVVTGSQFIVANGKNGYDSYRQGDTITGLDLPDSSHEDHTSRGLLQEVSNKKEAAEVSEQVSSNTPPAQVNPVEQKTDTPPSDKK